MTRVVVVTGGGKGIGREIVARFAAAGERVVAVGRDRTALEESEAVATEVCDVTDEAAVEGLFRRLGRVDVLVNNAGASTSAPLARTTLADWRELRGGDVDPDRLALALLFEVVLSAWSWARFSVESPFAVERARSSAALRTWLAHARGALERWTP